MSQKKLVVICFQHGAYHIVSTANDVYCISFPSDCGAADFSEHCLSADHNYCESIGCPHFDYCWPTYDGEED